MKSFLYRLLSSIICIGLYIAFSLLFVNVFIKSTLGLYCSIPVFILLCFLLFTIERLLKKFAVSEKLIYNTITVFCVPLLVFGVSSLVVVFLNESGATDIFSVLISFAFSLVSFCVCFLSLAFRGFFALIQICYKKIERKSIGSGNEKNSD